MLHIISFYVLICWAFVSSSSSSSNRAHEWRRRKKKVLVKVAAQLLMRAGAQTVKALKGILTLLIVVVGGVRERMRKAYLASFVHPPELESCVVPRC